MKLFRTIVFWCHLATALAVGAVVFVLAATGVLLAYEQPLTEWADRRGLAPAAPGAPLPTEVLLDTLRAGHPGRPQTLTWHADRPGLIVATYGRDDLHYIDAATGAVRGVGSEAARRFFGRVEGWHRWLGVPEGGRQTGRAVTGAANLAFLFLLASGLYLWWPRRRTRRAFRSVLWFRGGLSRRARDFNWHHVVGFWSLGPLVVVVVSGVVLSYAWAGDLVYRLAPEGAARQPTVAPASPPPSLAPAGLDALRARAQAQMPGWRTLTLRAPAARDTTLAFTLDAGTGRQPQRQADLRLDRRTGGVVAWEPFAAERPARRWTALLRYAHTGEVLGLFGQTLAALASLGTTLLVWTGFSLAWRRFRAWRRRRRA